MAVELALSADTVRTIVQKARAVSESLPDSYEDGHEATLPLTPRNWKAPTIMKGWQKKNTTTFLSPN